MLMAKKKNGTLVNLLEEPGERQLSYFCPACQSPVRLKMGKIMRAHFAHVSRKDCQFFHENESDEHLSLKAALFGQLSQKYPVMVERFLADIQQIADIMVGEDLVLEVQCSPLSIDRLRERTIAYQQSGRSVLWLLGKKLWLNKKLTALQKQFLSFSQNCGFYLWELDENKRVLRLKYLLHEDYKGHCYYKEKEFSFDQDLMSAFRFPFLARQLDYLEVKQDRHLLAYIQRQLMSGNPKWLALQEEYYLRGDNLLSQDLSHFFPQVRPIQSLEGFCQIVTETGAYERNFLSYYKKKGQEKVQRLYPPAFYAKIGRENLRRL